MTGQVRRVFNRAAQVREIGVFGRKLTQVEYQLLPGPNRPILNRKLELKVRNCSPVERGDVELAQRKRRSCPRTRKRQRVRVRTLGNYGRGRTRGRIKHLNLYRGAGACGRTTQPIVLKNQLAPSRIHSVHSRELVLQNSRAHEGDHAGLPQKFIVNIPYLAAHQGGGG